MLISIYILSFDCIRILLDNFIYYSCFYFYIGFIVYVIRKVTMCKLILVNFLMSFPDDG